eukprot:TRINITY_DN55637_c0_g1_i4.p1 TRINITY_DN55637_c0_g1~~TRINITY_DN55637_c0_g1_i4.p1  ORF type:complete len:214 (+),score=101.46 TRINITY_DN55637_c0_g1_i4:57-698(+)
MSERVWVLYSVFFFFFFFSSRRRHTRCREVSWARRCVQETGTWGDDSGTLDSRISENWKEDTSLVFCEKLKSCDALIFDLNSCNHQALEFALKWLKIQDLTDKKRTIILISSIMTWAQTQPLYKKEGGEEEGNEEPIEGEPPKEEEPPEEESAEEKKKKKKKKKKKTAWVKPKIKKKKKNKKKKLHKNVEETKNTKIRKREQKKQIKKKRNKI